MFIILLGLGIFNIVWPVIKLKSKETHNQIQLSLNKIIVILLAICIFSFNWILGILFILPEILQYLNMRFNIINPIALPINAQRSYLILLCLGVGIIGMVAL